MKKTRNPLYAPEFLEKKLSPSALFGGLTTAAAVSSIAHRMPKIGAFNEPPPPPPPPPTGPVGPA